MVTITRTPSMVKHIKIDDEDYHRLKAMGKGSFAVKVKQLLAKLPIFGICLGHQLLGLAVGINVEKLSFGHHGSNHPVKVEGFDNALITAQNHGFTLENIKKTINHEEYGEINQFATNLNDGSNEGLSIWESNAYSVQFHPESGPGPSDGKKVFEPFITLIENSED